MNVQTNRIAFTPPIAASLLIQEAVLLSKMNQPVACMYLCRARDAATARQYNKEMLTMFEELAISAPAWLIDHAYYWLAYTRPEYPKVYLHRGIIYYYHRAEPDAPAKSN